jgi:hypothetical protein
MEMQEVAQWWVHQANRANNVGRERGLITNTFDPLTPLTRPRTSTCECLS